MLQLPGETSTTKSLIAFISRMLLKLGDGVTGGIKLHINDPGDGRRDYIEDYVVSAETNSDRLAMEIEHRAEEEANGTGAGLHHFVLYAYRGNDKTHFLSKSFLVNADNAPNDPHETANERTLLAANQRHLEATMKINQVMVSTIVSGLGSTINQLTQQLEGYSSRDVEQRQLAHANTLDRAKLDFDIETRRAILDVVQKVVEIGAPIAIPKVLAKWMEEEKAVQVETPVIQTIDMPPQTVLPATATPEPMPEPALETTTTKPKHSKKNRTNRVVDR